MIKFTYNSRTSKGQLICEDSVLDVIRNEFSVENKKHSFAPKHLKKKIPRRIFIIDKMGRFPLGLYKDIIEKLREFQLTNFQYDDDFKSQVLCGIDIDELDTNFKYEHRYYQEDVVLRALKFGRGIILSATGSGKSFMTASLVQQFYNNRTGRKFKAVIAVPGLSLVNQLYKDFEEYGVAFSYSKWTGETNTKGHYVNPLEDTDVVIVNNEFLCSKFDENKWIRDIDLLIVDECHKAKAASRVSKIVTKVKTKNKFGFTGTLPDDDYNQWKIKGIFGPVFFEKTSKELRDEGYLTEAEVLQLELAYTNGPKYKISPDGKENFDIELDFIYESKERNTLIRKLTQRLDGNTLILVNHIRHGEILEECLNDLGHVRFIQGSTEVDSRDAIVAEMEKSENVVAIAMASIFSTGINVKNLHNIIFVAGGKSFIRLVQGIGRGLRLHDSKELLRIIDLSDQLKYSKEHAEERTKIYNDQQITIKIRKITL